METREDAIRWLTEHGYVARSRDWAVGQSILVTKREVKCSTGATDGLTAFEPTGVYIFPDRKGGWLVMPPLVPAKDIPCKTLDDAVSRAIKIVDGWEAAMALTPKNWRPLLELCGIPVNPSAPTPDATPKSE